MSNFPVCFDGIFAVPTLGIVAYLITSKTEVLTIQSSGCVRMGNTS